MTWNYRVVRYKDNQGYGLHEVYYDKEGKVLGVTENAVSFTCDVDEGRKGIEGSLHMALEDAIRGPVLEEESYAKEEKVGEGEGETV